MNLSKADAIRIEQHRPGAAHVRVERARGIPARGTHDRLRGEVEDRIDLVLGEDAVEQAAVEERPVLLGDAAADPEQLQRRGPLARAAPVQRDDRDAAVEQRRAEPAADEPAAAGHQRLPHPTAAVSQIRHGAAPERQRSFSITASL